MRKTTKTVRRMFLLAGLLVLGATAQGAAIPQQISIDRALNSPTLTIRYSKAFAALVELRINGESLGTRTLNAAKNSGETNFNIDLSMLKDGDNEVEVRLFDKTGKIVGTERTNISVAENNGPVFLSAPKVGATVMGPVELKVGFGRELKNTYVSFFIDSNFKSMTNFPPYTYIWDTERESNGWHEVEAWVIDETGSTFKTRKTRVFVNNPGGRTDRKGVDPSLTPTKNVGTNSQVSGTEKGMRDIGSYNSVPVTGGKPEGLPPAVGGPTSGNDIKGTVGSMNGAKPTSVSGAVPSGPRHLTPTGNRIVEPTKGSGSIVVKNSTGAVVSQANVARDVNSAASMIPITKGQRIPNIGSFAVVYNSQYVNFDVQPRVQDGVPMTPFRHLIEKAGGKVDWENMSKSVTAQADGHEIFLQIGDTLAKIDQLTVSLEVAPFLERGRTIVPLSFIREALNVNVEFDKETGHVLITPIK